MADQSLVNLYPPNEPRTICWINTGFIPNLSKKSPPGPLAANEEAILKELAEQVAEIALDHCQEQKRSLWYSHNRLDTTRPLLLVFPEDAWFEILPESSLIISDPFWKQWEWYFRHIIYRSQSLDDDFVIEPDIYIEHVIDFGDWGVKHRRINPKQAPGSWVYDPPLKRPSDIERLEFPTTRIDEKATQISYQATQEMFGAILPVKLSCKVPHINLIGEATALRGIEQLLWDLYDRPDWVHELMEIIAEGVHHQIIYLEKNGYLSLNNRNHYTDSGGIGYTQELPINTLTDEKVVGLQDLWGFGVAQELSGVGPAQHQEFLLKYQLRILKSFGLVAYGCCEPYTYKFDMLKNNIPQLRRISVSPWCNIPKAVIALQDMYIFSWKPNPAIILGNSWKDQIRFTLRETLELTKGCNLEIILKDTATIQNQPGRIEEFCQIAREEIARIS